jgi:Fe2+ or Zn2+ uptake regulation protein
MKKRNTIQKQLVLDVVKQSCSHPAAEEVYDLIRKKYPDISMATVYRNLNQLSEEGLIRKIQVPDSADRFDKTLSAHYHIYCSVCLCFTDVNMDYLDNIDKNVRDATGYDITGHDIVFKGVCPKCKNNTNHSLKPY